MSVPPPKDLDVAALADLSPYVLLAAIEEIRSAMNAFQTATRAVTVAAALIGMEPPAMAERAAWAALQCGRVLADLEDARAEATGQKKPSTATGEPG